MNPIQKKRLPNGSEVYFRSAADLEILTREFLADKQYRTLIDDLYDGAVVFDLGANIGFFVLELDRRISAGTAYCFEPIPDTFEVLQKNVQGLRNIRATLIPKGAADQPGEAEFVCFDRLSVASTMFHDDTPKTRASGRDFIVQELCSRNMIWRFVFATIPRWCWWPFLESVRRIYGRSTTVICQLTTISDVIDQFGVTNIDLLKIDVEGAEDIAICGIRPEHWALIDRCVIECHRSLEQAKHIETVLIGQGFDTEITPVLPGVAHLNMVTARRKVRLESDKTPTKDFSDVGNTTGT